MRRRPLGLDRGLPETGRGLVPHLPAPKVVGDELDDLVSLPGVQLLETEPGRRVVSTSPALQHALIHDVLGQRVLEAVHQLGVLRAREDEVEGMQVPQVPGHLIGHGLEDARDQRNAEASPHHRRPLERLLERFRDAVDAGRDDVVDGRRHRHVGAAELRLAVLDGDSARLLQLAENLLDVERIPLALVGEELEQWLGDLLRSEQGPHHAPDVAGAEAFEGDRLRQRRGEPCGCVARPRRQHQQDAMAGQAGRQMRQEFLGGRIDPVHVLDDEDERRQRAGAEEHVAQRAQEPLFQLRTGKAVEKLRRGGHTEEVGEQDGALLPLQAQALQFLGDAAPDLLATAPLDEAEVAPQQLHDRAVRHGAAIGGAGRLQLEASRRLDAVQELVQQPGFADPRIAHEQRDGALAGGSLAVESDERPELLLAADQRRQAALPRHLQPGLAADLAAHGVGAYRLPLPLDLELAQILEDEKPGTELLRAPAHDDLARFGEAEEARRQVGRVAHRRVVHAQIPTDGADHDEARVDPHAHAELDPVQPAHFVGQGLEPTLDRQGGAERPLGVILVRDRRPEQGHHSVTEELVDHAFVAVHLVEDHLEGAVHDGVDVFGV